VLSQEEAGVPSFSIPAGSLSLTQDSLLFLTKAVLKPRLLVRRIPQRIFLLFAFQFCLLPFLSSLSTSSNLSYQFVPAQVMLSFKRNSLPSSSLPVDVKEPSKLKKPRGRDGEVKEEGWAKNLFRRRGSVDSDQSKSQAATETIATAVVY